MRKVLALRYTKKGATKNYQEPTKSGVVMKDEIEGCMPHLLSAGSMFLLTSVAVKKHWDRYKHLVGPNDCFNVVESDSDVFGALRPIVRDIPTDRIRIAHGDFMETVMGSLKYFIGRHARSKLSYLHFDGCNTAVELQRTGFHQQLHELARSKALNDEFSLEITVSTRGDTREAGETLLNQTIPNTFLQIRGWVLVGKFTTGYRNPHVWMLTGKYKFRRRNAKMRQLQLGTQ